VGAAHHHAVQGRRMLRDVDQDGPHLEDGGVVGLQTPLGAVQRLRFGDVALDNRSAKRGRSGMSNGAGIRHHRDDLDERMKVELLRGHRVMKLHADRSFWGVKMGRMSSHDNHNMNGNDDSYPKMSFSTEDPNRF